MNLRSKKLVMAKRVPYKKDFELKRFADFILQSNKIQFYLSKLVILRSSYPDKEYIKTIERAAMWQLITLFCGCANPNNREGFLIPKLRQHNKIRNNFAHKVLITSMPSDKEFEEAIKLGNEIITILIGIFNELK